MGDVDEVLERGRRIHEAWARSDATAVGELLGDPYRHVDVHGATFDRRSFLTMVARPRDVGPLALEDEHAEVLGDVAVATSTLLLPRLAEAPEVRLVQVWARAADGWRRRWYQATTVRR